MRNKSSILYILVNFFFPCNVASFLFPFQNRHRHKSCLLDTPDSTTTTTTTTTNEQGKVPYYQDPVTKKWRPRIELEELKIGQELTAIQIMGNQVLNGKTGPKIWVDVGVGRYKPNTSNSGKEWKLQTAMIRLGSRGTKLSVAQKKAAKLRKKETFPVHVSRIHGKNDRLEVCLTPEEVQRYQNDPPQVSVSSLAVGQELVGTVRRVENYGVLVDVGANRLGLLHIQKVADLYEEYIRKASGLEEAGLERGARIKVQVLSNERKRLFLDFTQDVKDEVEGTTATTEVVPSKEVPKPVPSGKPVEKELISVALSAENEDDDNDYDDDDDYDDDGDYDEDRAIEDALGLGSY